MIKHTVFNLFWAWGSIVIKVLRYVGLSQDRLLEVLLDFSVTYYFQPFHCPGVDSAPSGDEYQEHFLGVKAAGACGWQPHHLHVTNVTESGSLNLLEPSGPHRVCYGTALPFSLNLFSKEFMWNRMWTDNIHLTQEGSAWLTSSLTAHEQIQTCKTSNRWQVTNTNIRQITDVICKGNCTAQVATDCVKVIQCFHCSSILHKLRHFLQNSSNCWINCCILHKTIWKWSSGHINFPLCQW
jgi:hypothetical protein